MKFGHFAIALLTAPLLLSPLRGTALAAAPSNDTFAGATAAVLGFSEMLDTTEATTDSDDAQLNAGCGFQATDASVWYAFTASSDMGVVVDVSQSSYGVGLLVGVGSQGNLQTVTCGPVFSAAAGTTYYVLAIDYDGVGHGGSLSISFSEVPPPPTVEITVDRVGQVNTRTGIATISGTYTCSNGDGDSLFVRVDVRQNVGRLVTISGVGFSFGSGTCDGMPHTWSGDAHPNGGKFAGGKAMTDAEAFVCGRFECNGSRVIEQPVQLRGGPK